MRILLVSATLGAACIVLSSGASTAAVASTSAPASADQQPDPTAPVAIVESFLLAHNVGDFSGAAGWCASLLELQDSDGSWLVDAPTTSEWPRQLANRYVIDPLTHPAAAGTTVLWTERLSRRGIPFPEASASMRCASALVRAWTSSAWLRRSVGQHAVHDFGYSPPRVETPRRAGRSRRVETGAGGRLCSSMTPC